MTEAGARLLRYCEARRALESEVLDDLAVDDPVARGSLELSGTIRIASFSSVARSCVLPALAPVFRDNPRLIIDFAVMETHELEPLLVQGSAELVILDRIVPRPDIESIPLGFEELVLVESKRLRSRDDVYLDHDPDDTTTLRFLGKNGVKTRYVRRSFFDDIYGVLDAAAEGYGRAVIPKHLLVGEYKESLRLVANLRSTRSPVVMHHFRQPSYTRSHEVTKKALVAAMPLLLSGKK